MRACKRVAHSIKSNPMYLILINTDKYHMTCLTNALIHTANQCTTIGNHTKPQSLFSD